MIVETRLKSLRFVDELRKRRDSFLSNPNPSARLRVPLELKWWYWLEFGTAGRTDPSAPLPHAANTYPIEPTHGGAYPLAFPEPAWPGGPGAGANGYYYFGHVNHPGIRARMVVRGSLGDISTMMVQDLAKAFAEKGFRYRWMQSAIRGTMNNGIRRIAEGYESAAPGSRDYDEWGKLHGHTAAQVFRANAEVVSTED
jgi:hypothetical protein